MLWKIVLPATLLMAFAFVAARPSAAQADAAKAPEADKTASAYRLDYTISELDDGKKINSRQYSMHTRSGDWNEIKIGSRVPVVTSGEQYQYLDVGTNIKCRLVDQTGNAALGSNVSLSVQADLSNFAIPEQQNQRPGPIPGPTIRQVKIEASTIAALNKSMVVGLVDDPNSKHQFQFEVTVTKLR